MTSGADSLSQREKETLRLLLQGHDAKSIARAQGLSVHTVNERLRDARRKLGVSSSRQAARCLRAHEQAHPDFLGDKHFGVSVDQEPVRISTVSDQNQERGQLRTWLVGGILVMSLIIASVLLSVSLPNDNYTAANMHTDAPTSAQDIATKSARDWVALIDRQEWTQSWNSAGTIFKSQVTAAGWASTVEPVRKPLGSVSARKLQSATKQTVLPGLPPGEYEIVDFRTRFATPREWTERVVLVRESENWKVIGYFILP